ncbi:hypothetical protein FFH90_012615 [Pseudomonas sp. ATCC 43928]|nr:hypothetical protein FFH90_012615 [Pseudomonas sp. ATCC 43928]
MSANTITCGEGACLWRGSLLPFGCEAAVKPCTANLTDRPHESDATATRSSGSKLPRHRYWVLVRPPAN